MSDHGHWHEDLVLPVLLGAGRAVYGKEIRRRLAAAGFDDMPRLGARAVGGIARNGALRNVAEELGVSKQAASQLVDLLVLRGYVEREPDPNDRRRVTVDLTERGHAAAAEVRAAVASIDAALTEAVGDRALADARAVVAVLVELGDAELDGRGAAEPLG